MNRASFLPPLRFQIPDDYIILGAKLLTKGTFSSIDLQFYSPEYSVGENIVASLDTVLDEEGSEGELLAMRSPGKKAEEALFCCSQVSLSLGA